MTSMVELRAFMDLSKIFRERNWANPREVAIDDALSGEDFLRLIGIPREMVEVIFINGKAVAPEEAVVTGGDRVALAPPGVPGPYRVLLGFKKM